LAKPRHDVPFRYNEMEGRAMGRRPIGDHPMTVAERQRRHLDKLAAEKAAEAVAKLPRPKPPSPAPPPAPTAASDLTINFEHFRRWPDQRDRIALLICQRLGRRVTSALLDALSRALEAVPEEPEASVPRAAKPVTASSA
jgi:hypothetical protein